MVSGLGQKYPLFKPCLAAQDERDCAGWDDGSPLLLPRCPEPGPPGGPRRGELGDCVCALSGFLLVNMKDIFGIILGVTKSRKSLVTHPFKIE